MRTSKKSNIQRDRARRLRSSAAAVALVALPWGGVALVAPTVAFAQGTSPAPGTPAPAPGTGPQTPSPDNPAPRTPTQQPGTPPTAPGTGQGNTGAAPQPGQQPLPGGGLPGQGTANDSPVFDINRTVRAALNGSAAVVTARRNAQISERRAGEIAAEGRPNVTGDASATRFDATTRIQLDPTAPPVTVLPDHTETLSLALSQRVDLTGQIRRATNQAKLEALADRFAVRQVENQRALQARTIFFNLLRADHQVQVAEANLRAARAQQTVATRLYEGGVGQRIDQLRANTEVAQAEQELERARNTSNIARSSFNDLVGRPLDAPVQPVDVPGVTVGTDIQTNTDREAVGTPPANAPAFTPFAPPTAEVSAIDLNQSVTLAQQQRPEVLTNEALSRASELGIRLARSGNEPSLTLSASANYYPTTSFQTPRERTASITAALRFPFYDGGATKARIDQARLRSENARTALESSRSDIALEVRQAYLNLQTAARQIAAANVALEQAIAARQLAQVRYEGQVGLFLEVTDAQAALVQAENAQVDAVYNYQVARAQFETALGGAPVTEDAPTGDVRPAGTTPAANGQQTPAQPGQP